MLHHFNTVKLLLAFLLISSINISCSQFGETTATQGPPVHPKLEKLKLRDGFQAEHLYSPSENDHGSWVSMAFDDKGRLITSDQYGGLYRLEIPPIGSENVQPTVEKLDVNMGHAQGLLWAFNSLYVMVNNRVSENFEKVSGLYMLRDTNNDDQFDQVTLLKELKGEGEHGPHSIVLAPDGNSMFVIIGNHTDVPKMDAYRVPPVWDEDNLFPLIKDPGGHATDRMAPGGYVVNVDSTGKHWELYSVGYRNAYDMAFNEAGDLFTFDSDMEWDLGTPWYRPTRICHITSGSEFGWRTGSGKWSPAFPDNLPAVVNIGQGSPTGVIHGKTAKFPEKFQKALFAFDWSFGIIYAVHLEPNGSTYKAEAEEFLSGMPLPLTDGVIGPDGAMYFMTGGRKLESDLYRVYHTESDNVKLAATTAAPKETDEAKLRKQLEAFHGKADRAVIDLAWPNLKHQDRFVRFAARIALEHQPVTQWQEKLYKETDPQILTQGMIALARHGNKNQRDQMVKTLANINYSSLSEGQQVDLLRAYELIFYRMGIPGQNLRSPVLAQIDAHYPAKTDILNRQLSKLLIHLEAPKVAERTMALLKEAEGKGSGDDSYTQSSELILRNPQYGLDIAEMLSKMPPAQQTYYATMLSKLKSGWTPELRDEYFNWFNTAFSYQGGRSYRGFIDKARTEALNYVPKDQLAHYDKISGENLRNANIDMANVTRPKGPGRNWKLEEALPVVEGNLNKRDFEQGKNMFVATRCLSCHTMRGEGNNIGPDLTQLGTRFSAKDMLEHVIDPNKEVSDQYASVVFSMRGGKSIVGKLANENENTYFVSQNPFAPDVVREIPKSEVTETRFSNVSIMMPGLINALNEEELKDLMAYLMAGGNKEHPIYSGGNL
ncbi:hypothetical protein BH23BAC1_BH23BAC1_06900 [soil metagenome]